MINKYALYNNCRKAITIVVVLLTPVISMAQNTEVAKKIEVKLEAETNLTKKMSLYLDMIDAIGDYDSVATERYVLKAGALADQLKDKKSKSEVYRQQGLMYMAFDNIPKTLISFEKSLELARSINDRILVGDIYNSISNAYGQVHNDKMVDEYMLKALKEYQQQNSESDIAMVYANMGSNSSRRGNYTKAIEYFLKSLAIRERLHNDKGIGSAAFNITIPYKFLKRYDEALKYNQLAIEKLTLVKNEGMLASAYAVKGSIFRSLKNYDEAFLYINKALPLFEKYKNTAGIRNCYDNIGLLYVEKKDLKNALKYFLMSKQISVDMDDPRGIVSADVNVAQTALDLQDLKKTALTLSEAEPLARKYSFKEDLAELYKIRLQYAIAMNEQGNANNSFNNYLSLKDSLSSKDVNEQISEMQTRYDTEKKDNQITLLNKEKHINLLQLKNQNLTIQQKQSQIAQKDQVLLINQLEIKNQHQEMANQLLDNEQKAQNIKALKKQSRIQELELVNQGLKLKERNIFITAFGILMVAGLVVAYAYYNRYKIKQETRLQAEIHKQQEIETRSLFEGEQNERIRIARDLHDSIGQMLSVIKMNVSNVPESSTTATTLELVDRTITEVRNISHNLIPEELNFGLFTALEDMCDKINQSNNTQVSINIPDEIRAHQFEKTNELSIYRIVQEVLNNMVKHAQASQINLEVTQQEHNLTIGIKDNGNGFDTSQIKKSKGLGWKNIAARVNMLDGKMKVRSEQLTGTQIEITIPGT